MHRPQFGRMWVPVVVLTLFGLAGIFANGQTTAQPLERLTAPEEEKVKRAVEKLAAVNIRAVTLEFTGSFESVAQHIDELEKELQAQKLDTGVRDNAVGILILREDPTGKSAFRMAVGVEVQGRRAEPKAPLKIEEIRRPQAVRYTHVGSYKKLEGVYHGVRKHSKSSLRKETEWPVVLRLLNDPRKVGADKARTEMVVGLR